MQSTEMSQLKSLLARSMLWASTGVSKLLKGMSVLAIKTHGGALILNGM